jgi:excisionase family DNA binding protein
MELTESKEGTMTERLAYSIAEAAEAIGISRDTVYRLIQRAEVHSVLVGKRRLIPRASLLELMGVANKEAEDRAVQDNTSTFALAAPVGLFPLLPPGHEEATFVITVRRARRV